MISSEYCQFKAEIESLCTLLARRTLDDELLKEYWNGLKNYDLETFKKGVGLAKLNCKRFPTIAELRTFAKSTIKEPIRYYKPADDEPTQAEIDDAIYAKTIFMRIGDQ